MNTIDRVGDGPADGGGVGAELITVLGGVTCPWSHLAARRAAVLAGDGIEVCWGAVEHSPPTNPGAELRRVEALLLPGEVLPHGAVGTASRTGPAVLAQAEAHVAGLGARVREALFDLHWVQGKDVGDPKLLRAVLSPLLRGAASPSEVVHDWGLPVDITGGAISTDAWRLAQRWHAEWEATGGALPTLLRPGAEALQGTDALAWLGQAITSRRLDPTPPPAPSCPQPVRRDQPALGWVSENGGRWLPRHQQLAREPEPAAG